MTPIRNNNYDRTTHSERDSLLVLLTPLVMTVTIVAIPYRDQHTDIKGNFARNFQGEAWIKRTGGEEREQVVARWLSTRSGLLRARPEASALNLYIR